MANILKNLLASFKTKESRLLEHVWITSYARRKREAIGLELQYDVADEN
jgi:hypothetical protein